ncbi:protein monooxygenase [Volvox carteri f. nagariensis]|uniref:Protein monooxygenase n=1 Tax=Volvox carteri f. nagariensis TaxID=3068 RepID=D8THM7_VOLCA|nr:protein monooxygenase [Volvox carteri f. nagariensis]EFJ52740.1 protein monooxygenase [Volvox carteri f. nagariensis]|eukprot:XP_002945745.1 protein monooxygenase [Volvox carteri f. nagariensis]
MARLLRGVWVAGVLAAIVLTSPSANAASCYQFLTKDDYPSCLQLDANLVLYWKIIDNQTLELAADGDGYMDWIAIGISEAGMKGVDYSVSYLPTQGSSWLVGDYYTTGDLTPTYDEEQNIIMSTMPVFDKDNRTFAAIQRPLDSCDDEDTPVYLDVERSIIWGYSWNTNWDQAKNFLFTKGILPGVRLFTSANSTATVVNTSIDATVSVPQAASARLAMPNYPVPPNSTTIACVNLALPNTTKYHVVRYQGFAATPMVVRMVGYVCAAGVVPKQPYGVPYDCSAATTLLPGLPGTLPLGCETLNFVWAPGAGPFEAPPEAGFLIGADAATSMVLQVVYWNPDGVVGQVDSSGFSLVYTPQLRNASLGVLTVGNTDMRIPAGNDSFQALPNICPSDCTAKRVLAPVTLVSNFFVMGGMGKSMLTRHIRNGSAIMPVGRINYWDQKYAGFQAVFPESRTLLPNDTVISVCTYDSSNATKMIYFGYDKGSELCFNYITFYPTTAMPDLDYCIARTRDNVSTCSTRTRLTPYAQKATSDMYWNGTRLQVGPLSIATYKSQECQLHDALVVTPQRAPNTRAAVASIVLVPIVLVLVGVIIWTKYSKEEEMERLLEQARAGVLDPLPAD